MNINRQDQGMQMQVPSQSSNEIESVSTGGSVQSGDRAEVTNPVFSLLAGLRNMSPANVRDVSLPSSRGQAQGGCHTVSSVIPRETESIDKSERPRNLFHELWAVVNTPSPHSVSYEGNTGTVQKVGTESYVKIPPDVGTPASKTLAHVQLPTVREREKPKLTKYGQRRIKNVLYKMEERKEGPMSIVYRAYKEHLRVRVWTRSYRHVRGICTGYIVAFDKHWNLAMADIEEIYTIPRWMTKADVVDRRYTGLSHIMQHKKSLEQPEEVKKSFPQMALAQNPHPKNIDLGKTLENQNKATNDDICKDMSGSQAVVTQIPQKTNTDNSEEHLEKKASNKMGSSGNADKYDDSEKSNKDSSDTNSSEDTSGEDSEESSSEDSEESSSEDSEESSSEDSNRDLTESERKSTNEAEEMGDEEDDEEEIIMLMEKLKMLQDELERLDMEEKKQQEKKERKHSSRRQSKKDCDVPDDRYKKREKDCQKKNEADLTSQREYGETKQSKQRDEEYKKDHREAQKFRQNEEYTRDRKNERCRESGQSRRYNRDHREDMRSRERSRQEDARYKRDHREDERYRRVDRENDQLGRDEGYKRDCREEERSRESEGSRRVEGYRKDHRVDEKSKIYGRSSRHHDRDSDIPREDKREKRQHDRSRYDDGENFSRNRKDDGRGHKGEERHKQEEKRYGRDRRVRGDERTERDGKDDEYQRGSERRFSKSRTDNEDRHSKGDSRQMNVFDRRGRDEGYRGEKYRDEGYRGERYRDEGYRGERYRDDRQFDKRKSDISHNQKAQHAGSRLSLDVTKDESSDQERGPRSVTQENKKSNENSRKSETESCTGTLHRRHVNQIFIRGDNVVMVALYNI